MSWLRSTPALPLLLAGLVACGGKNEDSGGDAGLSAEDAALADALWVGIQGYDAWPQQSPWTGIQPSEDGTHGTHVQIWVNDTADATITAAAGGDMPDGAILVKEGYTDDAGSSLQAITVMQKVSGYDSAHGDWFYARYTEDGTVTHAGQGAIDLCVGCHAPGQDSSRAFTW